MISVIVPVYNVKNEYFEKCMKSLMVQSIDEIEIIIIDDGSKREAALGYDYFSQLDKRVKVYHKDNGGVSSARNLGLEKARGEYVAFVDADDWVEPNFLKCLLDSITETESDLSVVDFKYEYENGDEDDEKCVSESISEIYMFETQTVWGELLYSKKIGGFLWNKLFKKALISQLLDESLHYSEDFVFTAEYCKKVSKVVFTDAKLYHYRQGHEGATSNFTYNVKILSLLDSYKKLEDIYAEYAPQELDSVKCNTLKIALNLRARYKMSHIEDIKAYKKINEVICSHMGGVLRTKRVSVVEKVNVLLTWALPTLLFRLKNKILGRRI